MRLRVKRAKRGKGGVRGSEWDEIEGREWG